MSAKVESFQCRLLRQILLLMYLLNSLSIMPPILFIPTVHTICCMCNRRGSRTQSALLPSHLPLHLPEVASKQLRMALLPNMPMQLSNDFEMALIPPPQQREHPYNLVWLSWVPASSQLLQSSQSTGSAAPLWLFVLVQRGQKYSPLWFFSTAQQICCCSVLSVALESFYTLALMASVSFTFVSGFALHARKKYVALFAWSLGLRGSTQVCMYLYLWVSNPTACTVHQLTPWPSG